ncbi:sensor histidine kinase [Roseomonas sp. CCTCC AB2023176]|uniref:sensor histidine kinase n=1 Tax=Roseomonas sp. CCTCC AB2023176 TaxID=3342640 RepID=UPI0035D91EB9
MDPTLIAGAPPATLGGMDEARLRAVLDTMPQMVWSTRPDGFHDYYNARWYDFTGVPHGSTDGEAWNGMFHPDDQARAWELWQRSLETGDPYEVEYRLRRRDGAYRWTLGRALPIREAEGRIERWFGTCTDIHDLKVAEEQRELVSRELSHRIKNIFAVVTSLISLTSRRADGAARDYAERLRARIESLAAAHEYVRPHSAGSRPDPVQETVQGLLHTLLSPYEAPGQVPGRGSGPASGRPRFTVTGADAEIGPRAATALALIFHELATNAVKYGALSVPEGRVEVLLEDTPGAMLRMTWREAGGPVVEGAPSRQGFGTQLARRSAEAQLGAVISHDWQREGLVLSLAAERDALRR